MNDERVHKAYRKVKGKFKGYENLKVMVYEVRDEIHNVVRSCANNVRVVIYIDEVLDEPMIIMEGNGDNRLRITIDSSRGVTYEWTKQTIGKILSGFWCNIKCFFERIFEAIVSTVRRNRTVEREDERAAIAQDYPN